MTSCHDIMSPEEVTLDHIRFRWDNISTDCVCVCVQARGRHVTGADVISSGTTSFFPEIRCLTGLEFTKQGRKLFSQPVHSS